MSLFQGNCVELKTLDLSGVSDAYELSINLKNESVNKFNIETLSELRKAMEKLPSKVNALLVSSGKETFVAGADITEFLELFKKPESELRAWMGEAHKTFNMIEDLNAPTVCTIAGFALGGGLEFALTCDYRVAATGAKIGLPETKLGIIPGWGGTVRLPRMIGMDPAIEWISSGNQNDATEAFKIGVVDALVAQSDLRAAGIDLLKNLATGKIEWKSKKNIKKGVLDLNATERAMGLNVMKAGVYAAAGTNYPAPFAAIDAIEKSTGLTREGALKNEIDAFAKVAATSQAKALIGTFLADQLVKKKAKGAKKEAKEVKHAAVLGAGIMGGGIAYQSAISKVPIYMKDIRDEAIAHGMKEASSLLTKQIERGKATPQSMAETLSRIKPTLNLSDIKNANYIIEAVTENEKVKIAVLKETEDMIAPDAFLVSNTSTISITKLAEHLKRPENFCGMHFFNPVPKMPLVEIIRGAKTNAATIATAVQYASQMGKTPIVVNDCPGFLINRVLFAYYQAFTSLIDDKVDFARIDKVMEKWGWPMGPAYLMDVVGGDTGYHCTTVMSKGFPDRMPYNAGNCIELLFKANRFGQKNGKGFYTYSVDAKGKPKKELEPSIYGILGQDQNALNTTITDEEITDRLILAFILESVRCISDKIVDTREECDLAMLMGIGFPPFRGGPIREASRLTKNTIIEKAKKYQGTLGALYEITPAMMEVLGNV